ncbi:MAG: hypothetical protein H6742_09525 [Alphaproteobacteria bacterium]|nr:hypothetical protein [Alphaproteobacteria bacterium]
MPASLLILLLACAGGGPSSPPSDDATPECGEGELYDGEACVPEACGMAPWGDVEGTVYVDPAAAEGGDGTRSFPLRSLADAVDRAGAADVIVLAAGTHEGGLEIEDRDLTLAGRCAALVTIDGSTAAEDAAVIAFNKANPEVGGGTLSLSGLTLRGGRLGGLDAWGGTVVLRDSVITENGWFNLSFDWTDALIEDVTVARPLPTTDQPGTWGMWFGRLCTATVRRTLLHEHPGTAIAVSYTDSTLVLEDVVIAGVGSEDDMHGNAALDIDATNTVTATRLTIRDVNQWFAISQTGGTFAFEDLVIEHHRDTVQVPYPVAIYVETFDPAPGSGDTIAGKGLHLSDTAGGILISGTASARLSDVSMEDLGHGNELGVGIFVAAGAEAQVSGLRIEGAKGAALASQSVGGATSVLAVTDAEIVDTTPGLGSTSDGATDAWVAMGATAGGTARLELSDTVISGSVGVWMLGGGWVDPPATPTALLTDVTIQDVPMGMTSRMNSGLVLQGGEVDAERLTIERVAGPAATVRGVSEGEPGRLSCEACLFQDAAFAGVLAIGSAGGTQVQLTDSTIAGVTAADSVDQAWGVLVTHEDGVAEVSLEDSTVSDVQHAALAVVGDADVQVRGGTLDGGTGGTVGGVLDVHGNAVYARDLPAGDGGTGLWLDGVRLGQGAGASVLLHGASATLTDTSWDSAEGELLQQHCSADSSEVAGAEESPRYTRCPETEQLVVEIEPNPMGLPPVDQLF